MRVGRGRRWTSRERGNGRTNNAVNPASPSTHFSLVCTVLPRPISSARMPLTPFSASPTSQRTPCSWYGRSVPPVIRAGWTASSDGMAAARASHVDVAACTDARTSLSPALPCAPTCPAPRPGIPSNPRRAAKPRSTASVRASSSPRRTDLASVARRRYSAVSPAPRRAARRARAPASRLATYLVAAAACQAATAAVRVGAGGWRRVAGRAARAHAARAARGVGLDVAAARRVPRAKLPATCAAAAALVATRLRSPGNSEDGPSATARRGAAAARAAVASPGWCPMGGRTCTAAGPRAATRAAARGGSRRPWAGRGRRGHREGAAWVPSTGHVNRLIGRRGAGVR